MISYFLFYIGKKICACFNFNGGSFYISKTCRFWLIFLLDSVGLLPWLGWAIVLSWATALSWSGYLLSVGLLPSVGWATCDRVCQSWATKSLCVFLDKDLTVQMARSLWKHALHYLWVWFPHHASLWFGSKYTRDKHTHITIGNDLVWTELNREIAT